MPDNHRRYFAIQKALLRLMPQIKGPAACHLMPLTAMICGIVGSKSAQWPAIANKIPGPAKRQSRITPFERWLKNDKGTVERYYLPYVKELLKSLPDGPLVLVIDGSQIGRGCRALVISVLHHNRALPLCWLVVRGKKGHLPQDLHCRLFEQVKKLVGAEREVIVLGDGEFDGTDWLAAIAETGWQYVRRTAKNACLYEADIESNGSSLHLRPGEFAAIENLSFTQARSGPVTFAAIWEAAYAEPLYLVTNLLLGEEACFHYKQRYGIETFFSDQKSRGFYLADSHLSDPARLERLLIASCLAYIWRVCLGVVVKKQGWLGHLQRRARCDLSLFQIGLIWLDHCLNEGFALWVAFRLPPVRRLRFSVG